MNDLFQRQDRREEIDGEARQMDDATLTAIAAPIAQRDRDLCAAGFRGLINEPDWQYVFVARARGLVV